MRQWRWTKPPPIGTPLDPAWERNLAGVWVANAGGKLMPDLSRWRNHAVLPSGAAYAERGVQNSSSAAAVTATDRSNGQTISQGTFITFASLTAGSINGYGGVLVKQSGTSSTRNGLAVANTASHLGYFWHTVGDEFDQGTTPGLPSLTTGVPALHAVSVRPDRALLFEDGRTYENVKTHSPITIDGVWKLGVDDVVGLNRTVGAVYYVAYVWLDRALTLGELHALKADPYAPFAPPVWRRYFIPPGGGATGTGAISVGAPAVAGTGTVFNPPTVVAAGTAAYTATNATAISPGLPAGFAANDIHVLIAARGDNTAMTTLSGWNSLSAANNTAAFRVEVWWRRAVGGDTAPTITFGSGTVVRGAQIIGIRGCPTNVDPFAVALSRSDNAASATVTFATITPDQAKTLLLALYAYEDDPSAASQITNWSVFTVSTSALGSDMALGYANIVWPTANSATGALTSTVSGGTFANSPNTGVILSLAPVALTITGTGAISLSPPVVAGTGTSSAPSNDGAITIGAPQLAGTGTFTTTGTGAPSIAKPVLAGTGSFATTGAGAASIGVPVVAGTGSFGVTGSGAVSIAGPVLAATGSFATVGTGSVSIGIPVLAATGTFSTTGAGAVSIGTPVLAGTGVAFDPPVTGTGSVSLSPPVIAGTGTFTPVGAITGTGAVSVGAPVVSAAGSFTTTGSGAIAVLPPAIAAAGSFATTGSGAISIGGPAVAGSGSAVDPGTGSGAIGIAAPVLIASGVFSTSGTGALSVAAPGVAGTGTFTPLGISGTGAITVGGPQIQGTGSFATTGAGTVTVGAPAVAGTGTFQTLTFAGTGTITIPAPVLTGTGTLIYTGTGTITIPGPLLSGYSVLATRAAASDSAYGGAVGSDAAYTGAGSGDLALVGATASDEEV
jgi:hypothetical protein